MSNPGTGAGEQRSQGWFTYENGILLILGFTFGLIFFDRNAINFLMPDIQVELGLSGAQIGWIGSGLALAWALSAYFVGAWSDRFGARKPFVLLSVIVFSACSAISGFATSFSFLLLARVVMGLAEGPFLPIALSIMNDESSPHRRGVNAGILQNVSAALIGTLLSGFLVPALAADYGWRTTFYLTIIPGLVAAFLIWMYLKEPERDAASREDVPAVGLSALVMLKEHNIRVCAIISIFMVAWFLVALVFLPVYFVNIKGFTQQEAGAVIAVTAFATLLGGLFVGALSDRIGRKPVIIVSCFLGIVSSLAALYFDGPRWMLMVLMFVGWTGTGSFPLFMGVVPGETVSRSLAATSMGLVVCVGELIGGAGVPPLAGWIADQSSLAAPIVVVGICAFCAGVTGFFLRETAPSKVGNRQAQAGGAQSSGAA